MAGHTWKYLVFSDLYRIAGDTCYTSFVKHFLMSEGFCYMFWFRTCKASRSHRISRFTIYPFAYLALRHYSHKFGISIPELTQIGSGFYISHYGGIVVNHRSVIGKNCNISQGVTLGQANRGKNKGCPKIGDNVYIGPGAKIVGAVVVGNNVAIGADCVVTKDISENSVVVGIPARIISNNGAAGYVNRTDYDRLFSNSKSESRS